MNILPVSLQQTFFSNKNNAPSYCSQPRYAYNLTHDTVNFTAAKKNKEIKIKLKYRNGQPFRGGQNGKGKNNGRTFEGEAKQCIRLILTSLFF